MSTTPTTDQPPGFDTGTLPPRPPWWRRKLVIVALAVIGTVIAGFLSLYIVAQLGIAGMWPSW
jgi:hypothetical protein